MRSPFLFLVAVLALGLPLSMVPSASAQATCVSNDVVCAGEELQPCGGPSPYGDAWDGFTGVWGETSGIEYGVGGWDRCYVGYWSAGAFVNMDRFPAGRYETAQARFDWSPSTGRPCYLSAGIYGWQTYSYFVACPDEDTVALPIPNPGWGNVLP